METGIVPRDSELVLRKYLMLLDLPAFNRIF